MKRLLQCCSVLALSVLLPAAARADRDRDRDAWYDGGVRVRVGVAGGEGSVLRPGEPVRLSFEVDSDAYVMVYAIDTEGFVRLLFPRFWQDDGWVEAGRRVHLVDRDLAYPLDTWSEGVVHVQAVASPSPFAWREAGLVAAGSHCSWRRGAQLLRIDYDPVQAFNDINALLFADWDLAVFAADYTYFHIGRHHPHPLYLYDPYAYLYPVGYDPWLRVSVRLHWRLDRGHGYCRPIYRPVYVYGGRERERYEVWRRETRARAPWHPEPARRLEADDEHGVRERDRQGPRFRDVRREERRDGDAERGREGRDKRREREFPAHGVPPAELSRRGATPPSPEPGSEARHEMRRSQRIVSASGDEGPRARSYEKDRQPSQVERAPRPEVRSRTSAAVPAGERGKRREERRR